MDSVSWLLPIESSLRCGRRPIRKGWALPARCSRDGGIPGWAASVVRAEIVRESPTTATENDRFVGRFHLVAERVPVRVAEVVGDDEGRGFAEEDVLRRNASDRDRSLIGWWLDGVVPAPCHPSDGSHDDDRPKERSHSSRLYEKWYSSPSLLPPGAGCGGARKRVPGRKRRHRAQEREEGGRYGKESDTRWFQPGSPAQVALWRAPAGPARCPGRGAGASGARVGRRPRGSASGTMPPAGGPCSLPRSSRVPRPLPIALLARGCPRPPRI